MTSTTTEAADNVIKSKKTYVADCWEVRKKDENSLHVAEMRMYDGEGVRPKRTMSETRSYKRMPKYAKCQHS